MRAAARVFAGLRERVEIRRNDAGRWRRLLHLGDDGNVVAQLQRRAERTEIISQQRLLAHLDGMLLQPGDLGRFAGVDFFELVHGRQGKSFDGITEFSKLTEFWERVDRKSMNYRKTGKAELIF